MSNSDVLSQAWEPNTSDTTFQAQRNRSHQSLVLVLSPFHRPLQLRGYPLQQQVQDHEQYRQLKNCVAGVRRGVLDVNIDNVRKH